MQPLYWTPKRIKELKEAGYKLHFDQSSLVKKSDQAISEDASTEATSVRPGPGLKQQAIEETVPHNDIEEAQASSARIPDPGKSFTDLSLRSSTKINELRGCFTWKLI